MLFRSNAPLYFIEVPFEKRLDFILQHYGHLDKNALINAVLRIQKRFGPNETKITVNFLLENKVREAFTMLLEYYDKTYTKAMNTRENIKNLLRLIPVSGTASTENGDTLLQFVKNQ